MILKKNTSLVRRQSYQKSRPRITRLPRTIESKYIEAAVSTAPLPTGQNVALCNPIVQGSTVGAHVGAQYTVTRVRAHIIVDMGSAMTSPAVVNVMIVRVRQPNGQNCPTIMESNFALGFPSHSLNARVYDILWSQLLYLNPPSYSTGPRPVLLCPDIHGSFPVETTGTSSAYSDMCTGAIWLVYLTDIAYSDATHSPTLGAIIRTDFTDL